MSSYLQNKLKSLVESKDITIASIEKNAGLKRDSLRNIITGKSKSPSLNLIISIAKALNTDISEFVESSSNTAALDFPDPKLEWNKDLIQDSISEVNSSIVKYKMNVDFDKAMKFVNEVYAYSIGKNPNSQKADSDFAEWLIKNTLRR